jgi:hypothetical protein
MPYMAATLIFKDKFIYADGAIREMVIWKLPVADPDRPHGLKYRLYYGYPDRCLVRYDNEKGKGDHRHWNEKETSYEFESVEKLVDDFKNDIAKLRGTS